MSLGPTDINVLDDNESQREQDDPEGLVVGDSDDGFDALQRISHYLPTKEVYSAGEVASILSRLLNRLGGMDHPMPVRSVPSDGWTAQEILVPGQTVIKLVGEDHLRKSITISQNGTQSQGIAYVSPYPNFSSGGFGAYALLAGGNSPNNVTLTTSAAIYVSSSASPANNSVLEVSIERYSSAGPHD